MDNAHFPWLILVPETGESELHRLSRQQQTAVLEQINLLSRFVEENFTVEKLNIACIGNIVSQLHIHIVGRNSQDICWPNVVWGSGDHKAYQEQEVVTISKQLQQHAGSRYHVQ